MSVIDFTCPHCQSQRNFPSTAVGQQGKCLSCQQIITIQPDPPPAATSPSATNKMIIFSTVGCGGLGAMAVLGICLAVVLVVALPMFFRLSMLNENYSSIEMMEENQENELSEYQQQLLKETRENPGAAPDYSEYAVDGLPPTEEDEKGSRQGSGRRNFDPEQIFADRDKDMDGLLTGAEISERMQSRVAEMDEDKDGAISKAEFLAAMQRFQSSR